MIDCLLTQGKEIPNRITRQILQDNESHPRRSRNSTHSPPKDLHRRTHRVKQAPEEREQRELDCPQGRPEQEVDGELQPQEERGAVHERGVHCLRRVVEGLHLVHGRDGDLVDDCGGEVADDGEEDPVVVDEESAAVAVLDVRADGDEDY